jgi:hypothetical protein
MFPLHRLSNLQGTAPFIAIELLLFGSSHRVAHDIESLFYVLLFICTHLGGPNNTIRSPPLYGTSCKHPSVMKNWLCSTNLVELGFMKFSHMVFFEDTILPGISPYFEPLKQHLSSLWNTIVPQPRPSLGKEFVHSVVTCHDIIKVFKEILLDQSLISNAEEAAATTLGKRSLPGGLNIGSNGWDVIRPMKKQLTEDPKISPSPKRRKSKLMSKGHRDGQGV